MIDLADYLDMVRKPLLIVYALVAAALVACSPPSLEEQVRAEGLAPAAVVHLAENLAVAARNDGGRVRVVEFRMDEDERWVTQEIAAADDGGGPSSAHLFGSGGETGEEWNSFFYGTAPPSVSRVTVAGFQAEGGQVVEGAWVVALREKDVAPDQVRWEFLDASGGVIESGSGIFPPAQGAPPSSPAGAGASASEPARPGTCSPDEPMPPADDRPGVHPPDGLLGSIGGGWTAGELGSFEWREDDTISEGVGVPALVPPSVTYQSAPLADFLLIAFSEPQTVESWELIVFPWAWYEDAPPSGAHSSEWTGDTIPEGDALCFVGEGAGEFSVTANIDFGDGNHAAYRWHLIVPTN